MKIDILTLFPKMFAGPFDESLLKKARDKGLIEINIHDLRDWTEDKHRTVDSKPFGGGAGMVMKVDVIDRALEKLREKDSKVILMTPQGKVYKQELAGELAKEKHIILICGHYEGFDERIRKHLVDEELSIGDYVLTGGEIPAMVVVDSVVRLISGVVGKAESVENESFSEGLLEYPQYTRPADYKGMKVPEVLVSGDHAKIDQWRKEQSKKRTKAKRPDLLK
ncbi:tRNA (guanosine(37)-N1)-methyltransferase TrmD [Patescibacteria group bacterium]